MKKTLIAVLAMGGICLAAEGDTKKLVDIMQVPESIQQMTGAPEGWEKEFAYDKRITGAMVAKNLSVSETLRTEGWHWGLGNLQNACNGDVVTDTSQQNIEFVARTQYIGEFVSYTLDIANLISSTNVGDGYSLTGLDITLGRSGDENVIYSVWHWDGSSDAADSVSLLSINNLAYRTPLNEASTTYSWKAADLGYDAGKILVVFNMGGVNGGAHSTLTGFSAKATLVQNKSVPEPATGTLSLLALSGLAVRRRKK